MLENIDYLSEITDNFVLDCCESKLINNNCIVQQSALKIYN